MGLRTHRTVSRRRAAKTARLKRQLLKLVVEHQLVSHCQEIPITIMKASGALLKRQYVCTSCRRSLAIANRRTFTTTSPKKLDLYDIVAVGGGPVGLALLAA